MEIWELDGTTCANDHAAQSNLLDLVSLELSLQFRISLFHLGFIFVSCSIVNLCTYMCFPSISLIRGYTTVATSRNYVNRLGLSIVYEYLVY